MCRKLLELNGTTVRVPQKVARTTHSVRHHRQEGAISIHRDVAQLLSSAFGDFHALITRDVLRATAQKLLYRTTQGWRVQGRRCGAAAHQVLMHV